MIIHACQKHHFVFDTADTLQSRFQPGIQSVLALLALTKPRHINRTRQNRLRIEQRKKWIQTVHEHLAACHQRQPGLVQPFGMDRFERRPSHSPILLLVVGLPVLFGAGVAQVEVFDRLEQVVVAPLQYQFQHSAFFGREQLAEHLDGGWAYDDSVLVVRFWGRLVGRFRFGGCYLHPEDST